ncbi:hypothetical protein EIP86_005932 [Pleurotus ostreatoroseus]|nr:hypothetical protein EIP86_005932 [Pleurotus ostreatoroseus]
MELSRITTYLDSTHKDGPSHSVGDIELQRLNDMGSNRQERAFLHRSSGMLNAQYDDIEMVNVSTEIPADVESGFLKNHGGDAFAGSAERMRELTLLKIPEDEGAGSAYTYSDGDPSPAGSETLPAVALEPPFEDGFIDRLARRWNLDWIADWEDD